MEKPVCQPLFLEAGNNLLPFFALQFSKMCYINTMLHKYIIVDDSSVLNTKHNKMFKTIKQATQYMSKHKLHCTHLIYNLSTAKHCLPAL